MIFNVRVGPATYSCAQCGYRSHDPAQFRRTHPRSIFNECVDRERCDQAALQRQAGP